MIPTSRENAERTPPIKNGARSSGLTALVLSTLWIAGVGSVIGIVLGAERRRRLRHSGCRDGLGLSNAAIVVGVVGLVLAALFWSAVAGIGGANVDTSSPSFIDGSNFATANYGNATSESSLCARSNAQSYDNPTQWVRGCRDGWFIMKRSSTNTGMPGLNA